MNTLLAQSPTGIPLRDALYNDEVKDGIENIDNIYDLLSAVLPNVYIIAGIILFIYAVVGGFILVTSGGDSQNTQQGQKIITNAIIGFVIIFASYWIIQIIQVITGINILEPIIKI